MRPVRSLSVVVALLFLAGCGSGGGGIAGGSISLDEEWQLGNQMAAQVAQQVHIVNDPQALTYLRDVGEHSHPSRVAIHPITYPAMDADP